MYIRLGRAGGMVALCFKHMFNTACKTATTLVGWLPAM